MNGLETALLAWGLFCTGLLILALGYIDVLLHELNQKEDQ